MILFWKQNSPFNLEGQPVSEEGDLTRSSFKYCTSAKRRPNAKARKEKKKTKLRRWWFDFWSKGHAGVTQ
jgi:hypothetical protein